MNRVPRRDALAVWFSLGGPEIGSQVLRECGNGR